MLSRTSLLLFLMCGAGNLFIGRTAEAQFGNPFKNTPVDPGTWKQADPFNKNSSASKKIDSVMGGRYTVTIRNPTRNPINYSFAGEKQIALLPGYKRTHTGVGTASIRFDIGRGDGTVRAYTLGSGQTYRFVYQRQEGVGATSGGSFLNLARD